MRLLLALLFFAGPLLGQAVNGWAPIENSWSEIQTPPATGTVTTTGTLASGQVALGSGATSITGDAGCTWGTWPTYGEFYVRAGRLQASYGLDLLSNAAKLSLYDGVGNVDLAISRPSAGLLLVEDGSGSPRDVQARTGTFGTSVVTPTVSSSTTTTTLTESSATSFATLTYSASSTVGAEFLVRVRANDATDFQVLTSRVRVSSVRKATGNTVSAIGVVGTDLLAESAGGSTLSCTFTVVEGASAATLQANCVSSLTQTTLNLSLLAETVGGPVTIAQL